MPIILGRETELSTLDSILKNPKPQFIALYGRRRVGKTYLIRNYFKEKKLVYFETTGLKDGNMREQIDIFTKSLSETFYDGIRLASEKNWRDSFELLTTKLKENNKKQSCVVFFDELPWLATKRSGFLQALDHYWNTVWSTLKNVKIIVCGSAASWMLDKIINAKGGLHNRLTSTIHLKPYNLAQTKNFLKNKKIKMSNKNILDLYMVTGGIPYYLESVQRSKSVVENINSLCFTETGVLHNEFPKIFRSLFNHSEEHFEVIRAIQSKTYGILRDEIIQKTSLTSGGHLNKRLTELEAAGFIKSYVPYGKGKKEKYFRIIDEYTLFYLKWIEPHLSSGFPFPKNHWQTIIKTPEWQSWAGYTYEGICLKHVDQILKALNLANLAVYPSSWRYSPKKGTHESGAQIDLLLDRSDDAINICEIKYSASEYPLEKKEAKNIDQKSEVFKKVTKTKKQIFITLITTLGTKKTVWLDEIVDNVLDLDDLFSE